MPVFTITDDEVLNSAGLDALVSSLKLGLHCVSVGAQGL